MASATGLVGLHIQGVVLLSVVLTKVFACCANQRVRGIRFSKHDKLGFCCRREAQGDWVSVPYLPVCNHYAAVSLRSLSELTTRPSCWCACVVGCVGLAIAVSCSSQAPTTKGGWRL